MPISKVHLQFGDRRPDRDRYTWLKKILLCSCLSVCFRTALVIDRQYQVNLPHPNGMWSVMEKWPLLSMISFISSADGRWGEWSDWSKTCNAECQRIRIRDCDSPAPSNGGSECEPGDRLEKKNCTGEMCTGTSINMPLYLVWKDYHKIRMACAMVNGCIRICLNYMWCRQFVKNMLSQGCPNAHQWLPLCCMSQLTVWLLYNLCGILISSQHLMT